MKPLIGILAGMGPKSTAPFVDMVVDECRRQYGAKDDEDFPPMMIYSLPTPFYLNRPIDHVVMKRTITAGLQTLASTGVAYIAMPCNTAHTYFAELQQAINIPLLNIIEETVGHLPYGSYKTTLLSTASTFDSGLYQKSILEKGHTLVFRDEWQDRINAIIHAIKTGTEAIPIWRELLDDVYKESIDYIIFACTDLNVVSAKAPPEVSVIDSSKCLAKAVVEKYMYMQNE